MSDVTALILAAGTSSRMKTAKQLLDLGGIPLLERVIRLVLPFEFADIVTVVGNHADSIKKRISFSDRRFRWIDHPDYHRGQSSSLKKGMEALQTPSVMVFLGDQPFISEKTIQTVLDCSCEKQTMLDNPFVVRPSYRDVPGHPVCLGNVHGIDFTGLTGDEGAKTVLKTLDHRYVFEVDDPGVVFDIDTPADYQKAIRMWQQQSYSNS